MTGRHLQVVDDDRPEYDAGQAATIAHAAEVIRYRAGNAMPGPWQAWPAAGRDAEVVTAATTGLTVGIAPPPIEDVGWSVIPGTAAHIVGWPPELAVLVADWLDDVHRRLTVDRGGCSPAEVDHAHAIARFVTGGAS